MKTAFIFVFGLLLVSLVPSSASSDCAVRRRVVVNQVIAPAVVVDAVTPVVATTFVPITVPSYGVSYVGGDYGEVSKLREEIKQLRDMLAGLAGPVPKTGAETVPAPKAELTAQERAVQLVQSRCASCHTEGRNPKKNFSIFTLDGKMNISARLLGALYRGKTADGKVMPPDGKNALTDEEVSLIMDALGR